MNNTLAIIFRFFSLFFVSMCDRPSESSSDDLKMHCLLFSFSPMLRTNSQQLNLHRHIYLSCKAQRNPALQYNIDCEIYQYLPARRIYQGALVSQPLHSPNVSTTPITAMGCRQCLPFSVVQLKGKHCRKPHCHNGVVDMFGLGPI